MSKLFKGFLNLSKCNNQKYLKQTKPDKDGNVSMGVWVNIWINDEPDQYGNTCSIQLNMSKEQREAGEKKVYVCNAKPNEPAPSETPLTEAETLPATDSIDPLPF